MLHFLKQLRNWWMLIVGRRGSALLFFAFLDFVYGGSLLTLPQEAKLSPTYEFIGKLAPIPLWGSAWTAVGIICLVSAFIRRDSIAFTSAICIKILWAIVFLSGDIAGDIYRGWVAASVWFAMSLLVIVISGWPETPGGDRWKQVM